MPRKSKAPFLPVDRSFFESELWLRGPFTEGMAWLDLNYLAAYEDTTEIFKGKAYHLKRGQLITSSGILAKRWNINVDRAKHYVAHYEALHACTTEGTTQGTTITIENYPNFDLSCLRNAPRNAYEEPTEHPTEAPRNNLPTIIQEKRNKELKNKDPQIIREFIDPKTGEERIVIRP